MTSTSVLVRSYTHSVTYVTDNMLRTLQDIVRLIGLDPGNIADDWSTLQAGISGWIASEHLQRIALEVYDPGTDVLVTRWDINIEYGYSTDDGAFWTDTDAIRYAIKKAGAVPERCRYRVVVSTSTGAPAVAGWSATTFRSTAGFVQQSVGLAVYHSGLGGGVTYYRKT